METSQQKLIEKTLNDMQTLLLAKNEDYGSSVSRTYEKYGMVSFLVRMEDKLNRLETLTKANVVNVKEESIDDTLLDLLGYACLAYVERQLRKDEIK